MRIPVDSTDAAELREAEAEREREERAAADVHDERCHDGWLGETPDGLPIACTRCRPHLLNQPCLTCNARPAACDANRVLGGRRCCPDCTHTGGPLAS
jgi:hypothetical protein